MCVWCTVMDRLLVWGEFDLLVPSEQDKALTEDDKLLVEVGSDIPIRVIFL